MKILVGQGSCGIAAGANKLYSKFEDRLLEESLEAEVVTTGCIGACYLEPIITVLDKDDNKTTYVKVNLDDVDKIIDMHIIGNEIYVEKEISKKDVAIMDKQFRIALKNCGIINPEKIEDYLEVDGYKAFEAAIKEKSQEDICNEIIESNLRGRGGGGFKAGTKWKQVLAQPKEMKYVVCNGDEGDPGAFMDRSIMEGDPHCVIEGMLIAGFGVGASEGYIYVRAEYPLAVHRLKIAINQAREKGYLGKNILGSGFDFDIFVNKGAGAFVCGEGSALTASIEGNRGMPRTKPPRTVEQGLWEMPTVLNNVETFANVAPIFRNGHEWFKSIGPANSPGTKAFAITGNIVNTGLIEVPMGTKLSEIIYDIGGGIRNNKKFKAVQIGGPSGACLTEEHMDLPLDFDSLIEIGAMVGSGGLVVMDEDTCMIEIARFFMEFTQNESCGKCIPCREGTKRMRDILEKIVHGDGVVEDLELIEEVADTVCNTALCGLGKTAGNPIISTLKYFKNEYLEHIVDKECSTKTCKHLSSFVITAEECKGCSLCLKACPVGAISGVRKEPFTICAEECIKCGACLESCPFNAIKEV